MESKATEPTDLHKRQIKAASRVLARAFRDDQITKYAYGDNSNTEHPYAYEFLLRLYTGYAQVYTPSERLEGVAVWQRYAKIRIPFWHTFTSGAIWPALQMGMQASKRMQALDKFIERKHAELLSAPHWYLAVLGVDPEFQGQGYASILVRSMLSRIDQESLPCFLETATEKNVPMYQHFGFKVIDEYYLPETTLKFWAMLRESKTD
jgi:ribosomal protein S18 acetylase RimI-like enzyme